jgi:hypothetical protein
LGVSTHRRVVLVACASVLGACGVTKPAADAGAELDAPDEKAPACSVPTVRDPDFSSTTAWSVPDGVAVGAGATFSLAAVCDHKAMRQTVLTPPPSCARPLVMTVTTALNDIDRVNFVFGFGGKWYPQLFAGTPTWTFCLGASAFDGEQTLAFSAAINELLCPVLGAASSITFQHLSIAEDVQGMCPLPGLVTNGDFEHGAAPWTFALGGGFAALAPGLGEGGSTGARIATDHLCEIPSIRGVISVPSSAMLPNPALRVWLNGTSNAVASVRIGPRPPDYLLGATYVPGTGGPAVANVCIPRWAQGTAQQLELGLAPTDYAEQCAMPPAQEIVFDGLSFVTDPACATDANVFDPGFELAADPTNAAAFWALQRHEDVVDTSKVELVVDPTIAHSGKVAARFTGSAPCPVATLSGSVTIPEPEGTSGPALKFWYDASGTSHLGLDVALGALAAPVPLPATTGWAPVTACLDPRVATHPDLLTFSLLSEDGGGNCLDGFPMETILLDDIELTTDPMCPSE